MTNSPAFWIGYIVLIFAFMYFIAIRPQQKKKKNPPAFRTRSRT